ncbi:MAG: reverse transcriptase domain-containing protein [Candidatus Tectomicrobia bacterium]|nr:reverse transcriptase domain-containing protein [Candidatus Tectomicrobia bacterium]
MAVWQEIPWTKVQRHVFRLQKRIYQATQRGDVRTVRKLQNLLSKSWYARLLAVRRVSQENKGRHTAGIDGVKSLKPPDRLGLARVINLDGKATPLRRIWIPKRGTSEKRPLGIPTLHERARQTLVRQALEPEWEAKLSAHFYGFRPGRSCWDAIEAVFNCIKFRPQHLLKVDISKCFDRIDHPALLAKLQAPARIRRQVRAWLRSGIMEADTLSPTTAGTPQGGSISPLLALIALHGIEDAITQVYPKARVIAYADDCLVLHPDRSVLEHCQQLLSEWLAGIGLTLNASKTRISHTLEGDQPGMDFLGFHIRQYRVGKHQSGKGPRGLYRLGYKTLIQPAKANVKDHLEELGRIIRSGQDWPQEAVIRQLNPKIRGWANYYRTSVCQAAFSRLDHLTWVKLRRWANRRHPHTSAKWIHNRYWRRRDSRDVFATPKTPDGQVWLTHHSEIPSMSHVKVAGNRSPYDGDWVYWSRRRGHYPTVKTRVARLLKQQKGRCSYCGQYFQHDDQLEVDHINGDRNNSRYSNLQALHVHCHNAKTREKKEYLPIGKRDKHHNTEERCEGKLSCPVLEQR